MNERQIIAIQFFITCCDPAKLFDSIKKTLDQITVFIHMTIISTLHRSISFWWNNRYSTACLNAFNQCIRIVALIGQHCVRLDILQQCLRLRNISHFTTGQQTTHRVAKRIDCSMNFTGPSATRTTYGLSTFFFWRPQHVGARAPLYYLS